MLSCAETWISYNSVDVIRPKRSRKYKVTLRKHVFLLFPLKWSDRMLTEILGYFSETDFSLVSADVFRPRRDWNIRFCSRNTFFLVSSIYWTLSVLVILDLPFHYRTGKYVVIVRFYTTYTRLLPSVCEIYAPPCKITQIQELYFLHSFNQFILLFSSTDRPVTINFFLLFKKYVHIRSLSSSFEHKMPEIPFLRNEHWKKTYSWYV